MNKKVNLRNISHFKTAQESPGYMMWHVSTAWRSAIETVLKPLNLTHPQFVVLASLAWLTKDGDTVSQADVGRAAGLDPNTTSQILRGLETKNLIKRTRSVDERSKNPEVTAAGDRLVRKALPAVEEADKLFFDTLGPAAIKHLLRSFQKLTE